MKRPTVVAVLARAARAPTELARARDLEAVVDHYDRVLGLRPGLEQKRNLVEFLRSL